MGYKIYRKIACPRKNDRGWINGTIEKIPFFEFETKEEAEAAVCDDRFVMLENPSRYNPDEHYRIDDLSSNPLFVKIYTEVSNQIGNSYQKACEILRLKAELQPSLEIGNRAFKAYTAGLLERIGLQSDYSDFEALIDKYGCQLIGNLLGAYSLAK